MQLLHVYGAAGKGLHCDERGVVRPGIASSFVGTTAFFGNRAMAVLLTGRGNANVGHYTHSDNASPGGINPGRREGTRPARRRLPFDPSQGLVG